VALISAMLSGMAILIRARLVHRAELWPCVVQLASLSSPGLTGRSIREGDRQCSATGSTCFASRPNGTIYVGVTGNLVRRVAEHRQGGVPGFTDRYGVKRLVWYETHDSIEAAIRREKRLKKWPRAWTLIESANPDWRDLWAEVTGGAGWPGQAGP
jgi:putative endonuclease